MKMNYNVQSYEAPQVEIIEVEVEKGFAVSNVEGGGIGDMPEVAW